MSDTGAKPIVGIVLAAGMSRRMGRTKQLLRVQGEPMMVTVLKRCQESALDDVIVVIGHDSTAIEDVLAPLGATYVFNPAFALGQSTSLRAGVLAATGADAVVVVLGDQPDIEPSLIDALIDCRRKGARLAMARYGGTPSHPVLFGRELFDELAAVDGDQGAREVIRAHRKDVRYVDSDRQDVPVDIDTDEDLARYPETQVSGSEDQAST